MKQWAIMEKQGEKWVLLELEGLCNPYSNQESASIDFNYLNSHKNGLCELELIETEA